MNPFSEFPNLGSGQLQSSACCTVYPNRSSQPGRQFDGLLSIGFLRLVNSLEAATRRLADGISRIRRRRTAIRALQRLSDHHLADIGLERNQITPMIDEMIAQETNSGGRTV